MKFSAMLLCDFYKISHRSMYPTGTELVYSTWTPRASRLENIEEVVVFGHQSFIKRYLIDYFNEHFFFKDEDFVVAEYVRVIKYTLGVVNPEEGHIRKLHRLGYLPLSIHSLPEGSIVPLRTPVMTIHNTLPEFFWLTNYIETMASCELWKASTSATIALGYKEMFDRAAMDTVGDCSFTPFQGHDFSMRGMSSIASAVSSGMGHLISGFVGTDTIPAIQGAEFYYNANIEKELVGTSIPASEHSVQCAYNNDLEYLTEMISKVHPSGLVSIVSDGYDFWDVVGNLVPQLKDTIMARDGKVVIRPDSGDPVLIVCGDPDGKTEFERKGAIEVLWDIFGGTMTQKGYKLLDQHIGLIYGDAITPQRAAEIFRRLKLKGFASVNVVFGIGSYTYQYNTRDTFGYALKSTLCVINGKEKQIFKDPKTDSDGIKKSQKGRVAVFATTSTFGDTYCFTDGHSLTDDIDRDCLREIYRDGKLLVDDTFATIRGRIKYHLEDRERCVRVQLFNA